MTERSAAMVIGSGIAGLAAARVLADRFERVTVLDRDDLPDGPGIRPNVPQGAHPHVLLRAGLDGLDELFPGLAAELVDLGGVTLDAVGDLRVYRGMLFPQVTSGVTMVSFSRPLLEAVLRRRLGGMSTVDIRGGTAVTGLAGTRDRVSGVRLGVDTLAADLVIDASGRAAGQADRWLADLGLPAPEVSVISIDLGYTTAVYRRRAGDLPGAGMTFVVPQPPREKRFGVAVPVEGDRWLISLGGWHGEHAPPDPAGFAAFARDLPYPSVADLIDGTERIGDAAFFRFPATRRRHLERLRGHPDGYLALGDSLCSFNPVYGQGMTSAVQQALALGRALDRHRGTGSALRTAYYRGAGAAIATPWQFAAGGDFLYPETGGRRPPGVNLFNRYAMRINRAIPHAPDLQITMAKVQHMLVPASVVLRPAVLFTVLRLGRRRKTPAVLKPSAASP